MRLWKESYSGGDGNGLVDQSYPYTDGLYRERFEARRADDTWQKQRNMVVTAGTERCLDLLSPLQPSLFELFIYRTTSNLMHARLSVQENTPGSILFSADQYGTKNGRYKTQVGTNKELPCPDNTDPARCVNILHGRPSLHAKIAAPRTPKGTRPAASASAPRGGPTQCRVSRLAREDEYIR